MIVITNPSVIANEIDIIHGLFDEGLSLLHIRKPDFSELEMAHFIHQIKFGYRSNLVLHHHHKLAEDFGIKRIHFSEKVRARNSDFAIRFSKSSMHKSASTHSIEDFNALENDFNYAFLSPVFTSISKENYRPKENLFEALKLKTNNKTKVIALGGIDAENIQKTLENGFDDVALLGSIWNNENPIKQFKLCQKIVQLHSL
ncbi:thiamine phosphate synthase [Flavobacterium psychroterrae]|uniref:Thiamine phosphate synthase n=2 Tax=Flavobacterium psychroterrae TaxID=2133767 RepID=A0ABS5P7A6_9FLAO|nr:thiamine phosphate synthase [Flavobacterium psychroterrae]MBS7230011.1 thiamine phosphate synthase [Flavobacterium psychroterrae]